jgi:hypothetical protein
MSIEINLPSKGISESLKASGYKWQGAKYSENGFGIYTTKLEIFDGSPKDLPVITLKGRVVKNLIESILVGASKKHLSLIKDFCDRGLDK